MNVKLISQPLAQVQADALVVVLFEAEAESKTIAGEAASLANQLTGGWIRELLETQEMTGKLLEMAELARPQGLQARKLVVVGGGKPSSFSPGELRKITGAALRKLKAKKAHSVAFALDPAMCTEMMASAAAEGAILGDFEPDRYKTDPKKNEEKIEDFLFVASETTELVQGLARGQILAESQNFARELVNEPGNRLTPAVLAARAREMASQFGLECEVLSEDRMRQLGMGALLGVAQGSSEPPALIIVRYKPEGTPSGSAHLALLGKGVTFDTGGISIKPADGMEKMKYDMAGGAAVLGAIRALAQLKPPLAVTALVPAVENMPGGRAQRPGDIVTSLAGKTVEVLNTDAEGRLILIDAIEYAKRLGCTHLIDAATLTGAIVVALGTVNVGVFTNNESFRDQLLAAARAEAEKMWPMPLDEEYKDLLKSAFADLANIGGRWGGAISAAMFLKEWADPHPWIHLDIAGTAWLEEAKPYLAKGPSGVAVRTFVNLAMNWK
ncbi:MAG: leucyl aminopeptidase [Bryobacteraceae bacterium]|nr:leucyl aminopeptidase [Bryobacteraceae bacterium]MDW8377627.1 leucyl aminopeptidase [Bryobacterales bacterium]